VILDEGAPSWRPIIICSGYYLPGEIRMIVPSAGAECSMRYVDRAILPVGGIARCAELPPLDGRRAKTTPIEARPYQRIRGPVFQWSPQEYCGAEHPGSADEGAPDKSRRGRRDYLTFLTNLLSKPDCHRSTSGSNLQAAPTRLHQRTSAA